MGKNFTPYAESLLRDQCHQPYDPRGVDAGGVALVHREDLFERYKLSHRRRTDMTTLETYEHNYTRIQKKNGGKCDKIPGAVCFMDACVIQDNKMVFI